MWMRYDFSARKSLFYWVVIRGDLKAMKMDIGALSGPDEFVSYGTRQRWNE
jgi:hypothetical protein